MLPVQDSSNLEILLLDENQARLHVRTATYDLDNTTFDCFIEYHGFQTENPQRVYSNEATLLVINGNYVTDRSGHTKYYIKLYYFRYIQSCDTKSKDRTLN